MDAGDGQFSSMSLAAQSLPAADAETSQAWNQYPVTHQQAATDNIVDGLQIGHTQPYGMSCL